MAHEDTAELAELAANALATALNGAAINLTLGPDGVSFTEAPVSMNIKTHIYGLDTMVTIRAMDGKSAMETFSKVAEWINGKGKPNNKDTA
ncbi:MAG: hypothetical protein AMJ76_02940 [Dehalococcoidia bacterium SM23_28_1]|nr:MAG: hypothetical protein AMJ76_02940 [Dehalococcoidia bacterium SM23_28_1]